MLDLLMVATIFGIGTQTVNVTFVNNTGKDIRLTRFDNKCTDMYVASEDKPVYIKNANEFKIRGALPVIHTYEVCGSGFCVASAVATGKTQDYTVEVFLNSTGVLDTKNSPEEWSGDILCP